MRTVSSSIGSESESLLTCSKFHFEEKVLEKLVRLEHKVEIYEETIKKWENLCVSKLEKLDEVQKQSETFFKSMQVAQVQEEIRLNKSYNEIIDGFKSQIKNETEFYEDQMNNLFETGSSKIQTKFQSFEEQTKLLTNNQNEMNRNVLNNVRINITNSFQNMESNQNALSDIKTFASKLAEEGVKIKTLERQVADSNRKVAVTACVSSAQTFSGGVVKFPTVYLNLGIKDIATFKTSGKFVCEFPGLYYISSHLRTTTRNYSFSVKKNGVNIAYSATDDENHYSTNPISAVVELQLKDTLYVVAPSINIDSTYS
ncbi:Hypothetical predicted protein [Mytilus galloprovincialis]|nr:Hypothetical predicted protein [Mytilus galloprovincialis]